VAANIGEIRGKVSTRIKDIDGRLTITPDVTCDVDRAILSAKEQYEKIRPRERVAKVAGTGGFDYAVSSLPGFVDGFSVVRAVAYPYLTTDQILPWLEDDEFGLVRLDTGLVLRFALARPASTEFFLAPYTAQHTLDASSSTVPASDDEALSDLGAAFACDQLAALYAKDVDSSISADAVDRRTKSDNYRSMAASLRKSYAAKVQTEDAQGAAVAMAEIDRSFKNQHRTDYLLHGRKAF